MTTFVPAAMVAADLATQTELDSAVSTLTTAVAAAGNLAQRVSTQTGAFSSFSALIPADDTIPQISEGTEILTVTITPKSATNILVIDTHLTVNASTSATAIAALFQDANVNALAASMQVAAAGAVESIRIRHTMVAGTVAATTFRMRAGVNTASNVTVNGAAGARLLGGVLLSSISVMEMKP